MQGNPPQIVVIAGPNGAGKTTAAPALLRGALEVDEFINADRIALGLSGLDPERAAREAGRIMLSRMDELADGRRSFAFESTLAGRTLAARLDRLTSGGYAIRIAYLWLADPDLAVARVKQRARTGGHDVPERVVRRRFGRSARNFANVYAPRASGWRLYDTSVRSTAEVARRSGAEDVRVIDPQRWETFQAFLKAMGEGAGRIDGW